jgi:hypothetical protein
VRQLPAATPQRSEAEEAYTDERDRGRLGHGGGDFGDDHLAVAGLEIGEQDLVRSGIKGAAATTGTTRAGAAAATPPPPPL